MVEKESRYIKVGIVVFDQEIKKNLWRRNTIKTPNSPFKIFLSTHAC